MHLRRFSSCKWGNDLLCNTSVLRLFDGFFGSQCCQSSLNFSVKQHPIFHQHFIVLQGSRASRRKGAVSQARPPTPRCLSPTRPCRRVRWRRTPARGASNCWDRRGGSARGGSGFPRAYPSAVSVFMEDWVGWGK